MPPLVKATAATLSATLTGVGRARRPTLKGHLRLPELSGPVEVFRDAWGVPHLYAGSAADLCFAQGFVHAQDRLWQMDFQRRLVAGRLAEVLGPAVVGVDRSLRVLGMYRVAEAEVSLLSAEARREAEAYASGVNAAIERQPLPVEFTLLRYRPYPWRAADSLCWAKMMSWALSVNWESELLRARLIEVLGVERAAQLEPLLASPIVTGGERRPAHPYGPLPPRNAAQGREGAAQADSAPEIHMPSTPGTPGSNNWVIAGAHTASGKPLLANDMHLLVSAPAIWYENHLVCTDPGSPVDVTGVSFPGIPFVVAGHNDRVAWGFTNGFPDVQDLFVEHLRRTERGVEYEHRGQWLPAEVRREEIRVKGEAAVTEEVIVTVHGPVINRLAVGLAMQPGADGLPEQPLALCWTSLTPHPMVESLRAMNRASSCAEFREALRGWVAPTQNVVYADTDGNIGYTFAGRVPIRPRGEGRVPAPGWTGEYDWAGWIPFEELPHQQNPAEGYIVSANNQPVDESYPYFIGREFALGDRAGRIAELIRSGSAIKPSDIRIMQLDQEASSLKRLASVLGGLEPSEPELRGLVTLVRAWDGRLTAETPAGTICEISGPRGADAGDEGRVGRSRR